MHTADFQSFLLNEKGLKFNSVKAYLSHINYLYREHSGEILHLRAYKDVSALIVRLKLKRKWSDRMTYKMASMACVYFNWACRQGLIEESPMRLGHEFKKVESKQVDFFDWDSDDFKKVMNNPTSSVRMRTILHILRSSGVRASELCNLRLNDIQERWLRIRQGKGDRERFAPIDQECRRWLDIYLSDVHITSPMQEVLFMTEDGKRQMNPHGLWKALSQIGKRIGVKLYPHKMRHSLAGTLICRGADITLAAEVLGHKSLSTTKIYTHFSKSKTQKLYDQFIPSLQNP